MANRLGFVEFSVAERSAGWQVGHRWCCGRPASLQAQLGLDVIPGNVVVVDPRGGEFTPVFDIVSVIDELVERIDVQDHRDPTAAPSHHDRLG